MSMTIHELESILEEAESRIAGREVAAFREGGPDTFLLILEALDGGMPRILRLLLSVRPGLDRIHLTPRRSPGRKRPPHSPFTQGVHGRLEGMRLSGIGLAGTDRVVRIEFQGTDGRALKLVAELIGRHANILLLDEADTILELVRPFQGKTRTLIRGTTYPPLAPLRQTRRGARVLSFSVQEAPPWEEAPLSGAADAYYLDLEQREENRRLKQKLMKSAARRVKREENLLARLGAELQKAGEADHIRKLGDLLQAHFALVEKGLERIDVEDLFSPEAGKITIPLDPAKGPAENIEAYYKQYRKRKNSITHLEERIRSAEASLKGLKELETALPSMDAPGTLQEAAVALGFKRGETDPRPGTARKKITVDARAFRSSDGLKILVGKDGTSNDRLTFHFARGNDMWLHCREAAGSHVVIRGDRGKSIPLTSLIDAGLLAVHFSKRRGSDKAEVVYTQRKYIRRIRGGPPGRVTLERFKTLLVPAEPDRLKRILDSAGIGADASPDGP